MGGDVAEMDVVQLVLDHHREIYAYAYRLSGSVADAEDLTQTVFLTAQEKIDQLRSPDTARAWLYAILRSHFLKLCRKRKPVPAATLELNLDELAGATEDPGEIDGEAVQKALSALPEEFRLVVVMFYFEQVSYREIAERLDLPMGTVMSRLARAKARLRALLADQEEPRADSAEPAGKHR